MVFPEGTSWQQVASDVVAISSGGGELWAVLESATATTLVSGIVSAIQGGVTGATAMGGAKGVLARRSGMTPNNPSGTGWDVSVGVSICHF